MKKTTTLFLLFIALAFASQAQSVISVDSARTNNSNGVPVDSGLVVSVSGIVYGPNSYPTPNGNVFMLQGNTLGIKVYSKGKYGYTITDGDSVTVIGTLSTYHGNAEIDLSYTAAADTIIFLSSGHHVDTPLVVGVVGEANESSLIQVNNVDMSTQTGWFATGYPQAGGRPHPSHSFNVHIGSLYLFIDSFMSPDLWNLTTVPTGIYDIAGFGSQYASVHPYNNGYSLQPRSMADFKLIQGTHVGISVINNLTAAVYPNPASTKLTVTFSYDKESNYSMKITDLTGRTVASENGTTVNGDNTLHINTSALNNGMYILELSTGEKSLVTKINITK